MDAVAIVSVAVSGGVALATLFANGLMRRGDRKHTSSLEFEKRIWETKSAALLNLISVCQSVLDAIAADPNREPAHTQYEVWQVFADAEFRIEAAELITYASKQVRGEVSELQKVASSVERKREEIELVTDLYAPQHSGFDEDDPMFEPHPEYLRQVEELTRRVGELTGINLDEVRELCVRIIEYARTDLRGK